jgi:hypothetical protein
MGMAKLKPVYFESMKQCAALLGIPVHKLKAWKAEGAPCFRYSRIYHGPLLEWIEKKRGGPADEPTKADWDRKRAKLDYERALFALGVDKGMYVELYKICGAVGQMLAGFRTAINMLPGSAARWHVGLKDLDVIKSKLQSEVEGVLQSLGRCRRIEDIAPEVIEKLFGARTPEYRADLLKSSAKVFAELDREAFK